VYVGEWNRVQIVAGGIAGAIAATAAEAVRSQRLLHYRFERRYLARLWKVPFEVVREFGLVTAFLLRRRRRGRFRELPFPAGRNDPSGRGRRGLVAVAATYSPNSYVVDIDCDAQVALVHELESQPEVSELS
jgi:hypothetical protein